MAYIGHRAGLTSAAAPAASFFLVFYFRYNDPRDKRENYYCNYYCCNHYCHL